MKTKIYQERENVKIAFVCDDEHAVAEHFGHASMIVVCEIEQNGTFRKVVNRLGRPLHALGHDHEHNSSSSEATDGPRWIQEVRSYLNSCRALIVGGIGAHAAEELVEAGIPLLILKGPDLHLESIIGKILSNTLETGQPHACCHGRDGHGH